MVTTRDTTAEMLAFLDGRTVLGAQEVWRYVWERLLQATLAEIDLEKLKGFQRVPEILWETVPRKDRDYRLTCDGPFPRIWLGEPGRSSEFQLNTHGFLSCAERHELPRTTADASTSAKGVCEAVRCQHLLLGRNSRFFILDTVWVPSDGTEIPRREGEPPEWGYAVSMSNADLRVRECNIRGVVDWCLEDSGKAGYILRSVLERIDDAVDKTQRALQGRLARLRSQREPLRRRLTRISPIKPGDKVWIVLRFHTWDGTPNNTHRPGERKVKKISKGMAYFEDARERPLWECYASKEECEAACPPDYDDD